MAESKHPALISRDIVSSDEHFVVVREIWDHTHPQCPVKVVSLPTLAVRTDVSTVARRLEIPLAQSELIQEVPDGRSRN